MKVGDLVITAFTNQIGVILSSGTDWRGNRNFDVLLENGEILRGISQRYIRRCCESL
jgi:hypothetical protein